MEERLLKIEQDIREHQHNGIVGKQIQIGDILDFVNTVTVLPTYSPRKFSEQVVIYNGVTVYRLYVYDTVNHSWRYTTLT